MLPYAHFQCSKEKWIKIDRKENRCVSTEMAFDCCIVACVQIGEQIIDCELESWLYLSAPVGHRVIG